MNTLNPLHRILWLLWALTLGLSFIFDAGLLPELTYLKTPLHLTSSIFLVLAAGVTIQRAQAPHRLTAILVAAGMLFGCLGDFAMADLMSFFPNRVLGGMLFFGIGHIFYILATGRTRHLLQLRVNLYWWSDIAFWQLVGFSIWFGVVSSSEKHAGLHYPALFYGALLATTAGVTSGLATLKRTAIWIALGAALFLFSDAVLAWQIFNDSTPFTQFLVWATYGPGQMFIVFGFARVLLGTCPKKGDQ